MTDAPENTAPSALVREGLRYAFGETKTVDDLELVGPGGRGRSEAELLQDVFRDVAGGVSTSREDNFRDVRSTRRTASRVG